jgi:hypothetical protein
MASLLDAVTGLLDEGVNPTELGNNLKGLYAKTWREIVEKLVSRGTPFLARVTPIEPYHAF